MYFNKQRKKMADRLAGKGIVDKRVLAAMEKIPRHKFVPAGLEFQSYDEKALPIGFGQTISHPYTVAIMTEALAIKEGDKVLEIGTGSGYQTAVLCEMKAQVFTVEIRAELVSRAKIILNQLGYHFAIYNGNGVNGWPAYAPYDSIILTAGVAVLPEKLMEQLKDSGKILIPVGKKNEQELLLFTKIKNKIDKITYGKIKFVQLKESKS